MKRAVCVQGTVGGRRRRERRALEGDDRVGIGRLDVIKDEIRYYPTSSQHGNEPVIKSSKFTLFKFYLSPGSRHPDGRSIVL